MGSRHSRTPVESFGSSSAPTSPCRRAGVTRTAWQISQSEPVLSRRRGASIGQAPHSARLASRSWVATGEREPHMPGSPQSFRAPTSAASPRRFAVVGRAANRRAQRTEQSRRPPVVQGMASPVAARRGVVGSTSEPARRALVAQLLRARPLTDPAGATAAAAGAPQPALRGLGHEDDDADMWDVALPELPAVAVAGGTRGDGCTPGHATLLDRLLPELHTRVAGVYGEAHAGRTTPSRVASSAPLRLRDGAALGGDSWSTHAVSLAPVRDVAPEAASRLLRPITALPGQMQQRSTSSGGGEAVAPTSLLPPLRPVRVPPVRSSTGASSPDWGLAASSHAKSSFDRSSSSTSSADFGDAAMGDGVSGQVGGGAAERLGLAGTSVDMMSEQAQRIFSRGTGFFVAPYVDTATSITTANPAAAIALPPARPAAPVVFEADHGSPSDWWQQLSRPTQGMIRVHSDTSRDGRDPRSSSGDDEEDNASTRAGARSPLLEDAPGPQRSTSSSSVQAEGAAWLQHSSATPMQRPVGHAPSLSAPASFRVRRHELGLDSIPPLRRSGSESLAPASRHGSAATASAAVPQDLDAMERAEVQHDQRRRGLVAGGASFGALLAERLSTLSSVTEGKGSTEPSRSTNGGSRSGSSDCYSVTVVVA